MGSLGGKGLIIIMHPRPPGMHLGNRDQQLTTNFKLWVENFCVPSHWRHVSMWWFQNRVCPYPEKRNRHVFVNISPTLIHQWKGLHAYYSMETKKKAIFIFKKVRNWTFLICAEINIQLGLNMHLYEDIGDASSFLRGSTSSYFLCLCTECPV